MNLELSHKEIALLLDSIYSRQVQINRLLDSFDEPKLIKIYSEDAAKLEELKNKLEKL